MHLLISMVAAIIPTIILLQYFLNRDLNKEGGELALRAFIWGVFSYLPILAVEMEVWSFWRIGNPLLFSLADSLFGAAIPEEFFKFFILLVYVARQPEFDEPMDGLVYGATISLGFAAMENTVYVLDTGMDQALVRAVTAVPAHASFGVIMGYFVGRAIFNPRRSIARSLTLAFVWPVVLHTFYNFPLLAAEVVAEQQARWPFLLLFVVIFDLTVMWAFWLVARVRRAQEAKRAIDGRPLQPW